MQPPPKVNAYIIADGMLKQTLIKICEKVYADGLRTLLLCKSAQDVESIDHLLWTATRGFLPHGTEHSTFLAEQPIYITDNIANNPGNFNCIITINRHDEPILDFVQTCSFAAHIVDSDNDDVATLKSQYLDKGIQLIIWRRQDESWVRG